MAKTHDSTLTRGFTIVELIVAMTLFTLVVMTFVSLVSSIQYNQRITQYMDIAKNAAISQMEKMRSEPSNLVNGQTGFTGALPTELPSGATGVATVSPSTEVIGMKNITVEVKFTYPSGGLERNVAISSTIGPTGIIY